MDFFSYVENLDSIELEEEININYSLDCKSHEDPYALGIKGAKEYVAATLLTSYLDEYDIDKTLPLQKIRYMLFHREIDVIQFQNILKTFIETTKAIPYEQWESVLNYIKENVNWVKRHPCSRLN
ncbi:hypothetical protein [Clostridium cellulovorans]|uniref:Uncharacterized protein n=1 Tax=Clostridium cellulovorans (strain ATCC 35296 / DSM 3052 / OCM 3 / 743B) TaxID=573061 RepID=D9SMA0_CLOC7|nr:hypothetical protein [Clostridium cellulovorans]ADL53756.1 hypothetical protein Clocel_4094 [Clostridium cellulovorans 743B]